MTTRMLGGRNKIDDSDLFDDTAGYDDEIGIRFAPNLTLMERQQATSLYRLFNGLWGVCAIFGDPGTGKDLLGNYIAYKVKKFFPWKRIVRDEKPYPLFGKYSALFDEQVIVSDLRKMMAIAKGKRDNGSGEIEALSLDIDRKLEMVADDWVKGAGEVLLKNSLVYLTEWWRYCYNREPHSPMNKTMGAIHKTKRHLDCLILGTAQLYSELDRFTCLPWIDWRVTCTRSTVNKTGFSFFVEKVKYDKRLHILLPIGRPFPIRFDAGKPRTEMGDGRITILKPNYKPETDEERIVLDVLKAGGDNYEELVDFIETNGDMTEDEILSTLKELSFIPRKHVVDFPCYFRLYNSKSAPQLRTSLKVTEE